MGDNMFPHMKEVPAHFRSPTPNLKIFKLSDLEKATNDFSPNLILGEGGSGTVFFGWVEENTLAPSKQGVGMVVAVKRLKKKSSKGSTECKVTNLLYLRKDKLQIQKMSLQFIYNYNTS
ncbi:hypothetical protein E3N88_22916 [Mikania micrantha]|uniref:Protein kinase domain-containing protein n=1 Tax=Mikania micrantha TaxID=192012 RepID=A0A5N6NEH0_9ASTR|nr:hypothetical protein E3N88_22916 [Mikania micrantha]